MPADPVIAPLGDLTDVLAAIGSRAAEHDRQATFPFEAFSALWSTGALNLTIPVEHGGHGAGLVPTDRARAGRGRAATRPSPCRWPST